MHRDVSYVMSTNSLRFVVSLRWLVTVISFSGHALAQSSQAMQSDSPVSGFRFSLVRRDTAQRSWAVPPDIARCKCASGC
jgi:hypothetical protein